MDKICIYDNGEIVSIDSVKLDNVVQRLIDTEFKSSNNSISNETKTLINKLGFKWDPLSKPGYLTFESYAACMEENVKVKAWENVNEFCNKIGIPVQRIAGGDLYSLDNPLISKHVTLAEEVGMYGDGLLNVTGNNILRFSGCSNKLAMLKNINFDNVELPFGVFEISNSYRYEKEEALECLVRNRMFHLPELHIVNENIQQGLANVLLGHNWMQQSMNEHNLDFIMLISTTENFIKSNRAFIDEICSNALHYPVFYIAEEDTCENGIVFDVEYKACMDNNCLLEIGTFQLDVGSTDFAYGICYRGKPVTTVHAVFFASSVERTIFTYCDLSTKNNVGLPRWLSPIQYRIVPRTIDNLDEAYKCSRILKTSYRVEVDDRDVDFEEKMKDAVSLKVYGIIVIGPEIKMFDYNSSRLIDISEEYLEAIVLENQIKTTQFSPVSLSKKLV